MTDKIITTFETTITWYAPSDILPEKDSLVLILTEGMPVMRYNIFIVRFNSSLKQFQYPGSITGAIFPMEFVLKWAPLPKFGDEE